MHLGLVLLWTGCDPWGPVLPSLLGIRWSRDPSQPPTPSLCCRSPLTGWRGACSHGAGAAGGRAGAELPCSPRAGQCHGGSGVGLCRPGSRGRPATGRALPARPGLEERSGLRGAGRAPRPGPSRTTAPRRSLRVYSVLGPAASRGRKAARRRWPGQAPGRHQAAVHSPGSPSPWVPSTAGAWPGAGPRLGSTAGPGPAEWAVRTCTSETAAEQGMSRPPRASPGSSNPPRPPACDRPTATPRPRTQQPARGARDGAALCAATRGQGADPRAATGVGPATGPGRTS